MTTLTYGNRTARRLEILESVSDSMPVEAFETVSPRPHQLEAHKAILTWIGTVDAVDVHGGLYLAGPVGSGKTLLAARAAQVVRAKGTPVLFVRAAELLNHLRDFSNMPEVRRWRKFLRTADVLVIDDLGAHRTTEFAIEELVAAMEFRDHRRMPTIVTSNLVDDLLDVVGARLADRIRDLKMVHVNGPSQRGGK